MTNECLRLSGISWGELKKVRAGLLIRQNGDTDGNNQTGSVEGVRDQATDV